MKDFTRCHLQVRRAADHLIRHINAMLAEHSNECARLRLDSIEHAQSFLPNLKMVLDPKVSVLFGSATSPTGFYVNYRVTVSAAPSNALFEVDTKRLESIKASIK